MAVILEAADRLAADGQRAHGAVRICFTCDEEIGRGVDHIDIQRLGAAACYTLDGQGAGIIDVETFSADLAIVTIRGRNIHPSIAKGKMVNAVRAAAISPPPATAWRLGDRRSRGFCTLRWPAAWRTRLKILRDSQHAGPRRPCGGAPPSGGGDRPSSARR